MPTPRVSGNGARPKWDIIKGGQLEVSHGAEEEPEEEDQWQYVETSLPELFDTETGAKLHYRKSCRGLEKANSVLNVRPCE